MVWQLDWIVGSHTVLYLYLSSCNPKFFHHSYCDELHIMCTLLTGLLLGLLACGLFPRGDAVYCSNHSPAEWEDRVCWCRISASLLPLSLFKQSIVTVAFVYFQQGRDGKWSDVVG